VLVTVEPESPVDAYEPAAQARWRWCGENRGASCLLRVTRTATISKELKFSIVRASSKIRVASWDYVAVVGPGRPG